MIGPSRALRVYAWTEPVDGRKGFNGLLGLVEAALGRRPRVGECFLFTNRRRKTAKVLLWDGNGLCIYQKRLARGCFACLWRDGPGAPARLSG